MEIIQKAEKFDLIGRIIGLIDKIIIGLCALLFLLIIVIVTSP